MERDAGPLVLTPDVNDCDFAFGLKSDGSNLSGEDLKNLLNTGLSGCQKCVYMKSEVK